MAVAVTVMVYDPDSVEVSVTIARLEELDDPGVTCIDEGLNEVVGMFAPDGVTVADSVIVPVNP